MIEISKAQIDVVENEAKDYAKIVVEPLEKGFGLTIGNCLRRMLLSALPGAAVQGIKFPDGKVKHEFSAIEGVKEDVTEIILNLKLLAIKTSVTDKDYTKTLRLTKEGPAIITAADISQDAEIEIINADQYICTVDKGGVIDMEITIGRGRGYRAAKDNKQPVIDYIPIDSIYTPVKKVNYNVEPARVGQDIVFPFQSPALKIIHSLILNYFTVFSTSSRFGTAICAPRRVTAIPEHSDAKRAETSKFSPSASFTHNPPQKVSPAPVVSTASPTLTGGIA